GLAAALRGAQAAARHGGHAGWPRFLSRYDSLEQPVRERPDRGNPDPLALDVVERLDRGIIGHDHAHVHGRSRHGGDGLGRHALRQEAHRCPASQAKIDAVGDETLLQPGVACKARHLKLEPALGEDADRDTDIDRRECPDAGAEAMFVEAPESVEELERVARSFDVPQFANPLVGGRTPLLSPKEFEQLGFNAICFGLETIMHAAKAMKIVLEDMRAGTFALRDQGMGFEEFKALVHYDRWDRIDNLYGRPENLQTTTAGSRAS